MTKIGKLVSTTLTGVIDRKMGGCTFIVNVNLANNELEQISLVIHDPERGGESVTVLVSGIRLPRDGRGLKDIHNILAEFSDVFEDLRVEVAKLSGSFSEPICCPCTGLSSEAARPCDCKCHDEEVDLLGESVAAKNAEAESSFKDSFTFSTPEDACVAKSAFELYGYQDLYYGVVDCELIIRAKGT